MSGTHILIVEDEPMIALLLEDFLDLIGHACVGPATTVQQAHELVDAGGFAAAILDYNLNGQKVWPVAEKLVAAGVPFLFASGAADEKPPGHLASHPILIKPYGLAALEEALAGILGAGILGE